MARADSGIEAVQRRWQDALRSSSGGPRSASKALSICGPSGAGKTTIARALAESYPTYIENVSSNPHLRSLLEGKTSFNAFDNQRWFLSRVITFVEHADSNAALVLDQEPAAIVLAYARMFYEDGGLSELHYIALLERLVHTEVLLKRWGSPRTVIFLDAPADVLYSRVVQRNGVARTPGIEWFERVRTYFRQLPVFFPKAVIVSTSQLSAEQTVSRAQQALGLSQS